MDRLRDRRHAELVERIVALLRALGWEVVTEVSFNHFGERGSIDILAFHRATTILRSNGVPTPPRRPVHARGR